MPTGVAAVLAGRVTDRTRWNRKFSHRRSWSQPPRWWSARL